MIVDEIKTNKKLDIIIAVIFIVLLLSFITAFTVMIIGMTTGKSTYEGAYIFDIGGDYNFTHTENRNLLTEFYLVRIYSTQYGEYVDVYKVSSTTNSLGNITYRKPILICKLESGVRYPKIELIRPSFCIFNGIDTFKDLKDYYSGNEKVSFER